MTFENACFGWSVRVKLGNCIFACECGDKATVVIFVSQEWENVADTFAEYCFATEAGDALHRAIPRDDAAVAIEREHTIDARVDHPVEQQCGIVFQN